MNVKITEPLLSVRIKPKTSADREKMDHGLSKLASEDSSFLVSTDIASGQTFLKGVDELHLDSLLSRLIHEFMVEVEIGAPTVAYRRIGAELLEPIMKIEVTSPNEYAVRIIGDLKTRRGTILGQDAMVKIYAFVPLANMFGYLNTLRSISSGHADFSMQFDHYAVCPIGSDPDDRPPTAIALKAWPIFRS